MRVYPPLKFDHPLIGLMGGCALCHEGFSEGQRTVLAPVRTPLEGFESVPAVPVHATCALKGMRVSPILRDITSPTYDSTGSGVIERITDGNGSPFPVRLEDGRQYKFEEVGLTGS